MSRRFPLALAAFLSLAGFHLTLGQDLQQTLAAAPTTDTTAAGGENIAALKAENAVLKKEVADAKVTIAKLQEQLAQGSTASAAGTTPGAAPVVPAGPQKALPLDSTNVVTMPGVPGATPATDAGPSRSYTVVKGDSLWKIAHKEYPHDTKNGVDKLTEANKDTIAGKPLKIGQVLVVPQ